jgi:hypothetical protein
MNPYLDRLKAKLQEKPLPRVGLFRKTRLLSPSPATPPPRQLSALTQSRADILEPNWKPPATMLTALGIGEVGWCIDGPVDARNGSSLRAALPAQLAG